MNGGFVSSGIQRKISPTPPKNRAFFTFEAGKMLSFLRLMACVVVATAAAQQCDVRPTSAEAVNELTGKEYDYTAVPGGSSKAECHRPSSNINYARSTQHAHLHLHSPKGRHKMHTDKRPNPSPSMQGTALGSSEPTTVQMNVYV